MARNTSHLAPSNRWEKSRLKTYSGRSGSASLNRSIGGGVPEHTYKPLGSSGSTKVRSGAASQKEYINTSGVDSMRGGNNGNLGWSQSRLDKVNARRKKNKSKK